MPKGIMSLFDPERIRKMGPDAMQSLRNRIPMERLQEMGPDVMQSLRNLSEIPVESLQEMGPDAIQALRDRIPTESLQEMGSDVMQSLRDRIPTESLQEIGPALRKGYTVPRDSLQELMTRLGAGAPDEIRSASPRHYGIPPTSRRSYGITLNSIPEPSMRSEEAARMQLAERMGLHPDSPELAEILRRQRVQMAMPQYP